MMLGRTVLDGRARAKRATALTQTVIDRPTPRKTVIDRKEGDCACFYRQDGHKAFVPACPHHDAPATGNRPGSNDRGGRP